MSSNKSYSLFTRSGDTTRRRGSNAIEFAMVVPVLLVLMFGMGDYGWYYFNHALSSHAVIAAMRAGSITKPNEEEVGTGECEPCIARFKERAVAGLNDIGIEVSDEDLDPQMVDIGGACTLLIDVEIPHRSLIGFVGVPESYTFRSAIAAPSVTGCGA